MNLIKPKLQYLEGLRGLAAIIVVLHHYTYAFYPTLNNGNIQQSHIENIEVVFATTPLNVFYNGGFAVALFFVLSGYVLSFSYFKTKHINVILKNAAKRYFRLLIPVGGSVIIACCFIKLGFMFNSQIAIQTKNTDWLNGCFYESGSLFSIAKNMFVDVFFFRDNKYNPVLWTMTYELLGSFLLFLFLLTTHWFKQKLIFYLLIILTLFYLNESLYAAFLLGSVLHLFSLQNLKKTYKNTLLIFIGLIGLFLSSYPAIENTNNTCYLFITTTLISSPEFYHVIGAFMLLFIVLNSMYVQKLLSHNLLNYIGKISFSFYLLHFIVLCSLSSWLFIYFEKTNSYNLSVLFSFIISLPAILISAHFYYKHIDTLGIKLSENLARVIGTIKNNILS